MVNNSEEGGIQQVGDEVKAINIIRLGSVLASSQTLLVSFTFFDSYPASMTFFSKSHMGPTSGSFHWFYVFYVVSLVLAIATSAGAKLYSYLLRFEKAQSSNFRLGVFTSGNGDQNSPSPLNQLDLPFSLDSVLAFLLTVARLSMTKVVSRPISLCVLLPTTLMLMSFVFPLMAELKHDKMKVVLLEHSSSLLSVI